MVERLARMVGAPVGILAELIRPIQLRGTRAAGLVDLGWAGAKERELFHQYSGGCDFYSDPTMEFIAQRIELPFAASRQQIVDDTTWYRSPHAQEVRRGSDVDHFIMSHVPLPELGVNQYLYLLRSWGQLPLPAQAGKLVRIFHEELALLLKSDARRARPAEQALSPRLRQTLGRLAAGDSEKQIAAELGLSAHTVHEYVKALHRRFHVSSRSELLAQYAAVSRDARPRLAAWSTATDFLEANTAPPSHS